MIENYKELLPMIAMGIIFGGLYELLILIDRKVANNNQEKKLADNKIYLLDRGTIKTNKASKTIA
ncbi:hypothetical protein [Lactococcus fujiensis]|uniref:Uncharacterized protein n=1 Tax=Lactococcus fujiensis JCM 16395 TaxID=1291764 RepID=A0A2A5RKS7_9LACT|nr:hypothetical protein [Lactococcus fujiensis]PCR99794.1 hypothetical protein RT41_GL001600 [Lactococcus fujiensis JCM 16395]